LANILLRTNDEPLFNLIYSQYTRYAADVNYAFGMSIEYEQATATYLNKR
jgi:hypothetical protein